MTSLLPNTLYYFRANSADPSGNVASSTGQFVTVADTTPPVISATSTIVNDTAAFINWATDELAYGYVNYGLSADALTNQVAITSTTKTSHSLPITGLTILTPYFYQIIAADPSANTTTAPTLSFTTLAAGFQNVTVSRIIDNTQPSDKRAPDVSNLKVTAISAFGATVTWDTDEDGNSLVKYGRTVNYGSLAGDESTFGSSHSIPLVNLNPGTTYHIKAISFDKGGNIGESTDQTFTTLNIDGTIVSSVEEAVTSQEEKDRAANDFMLDKLKNAPTRLLSSIIDALINNEAFKNVSDDVAVRSFAQFASQLGTAPTIVGIRPEVTVHGNAATIKWTTDKITNGMVSFAKETEYLAGSDHPYTTTIVDGDTLSNIHTVELTSLDSATRYHFQVFSKGEIGPSGKSADYTFVTEAVLPSVTDVKVTNINAN
ncbi:MAG: fibronectin type III domain-containing protein, partial [Patescibacteria group bacterium]